MLPYIPASSLTTLGPRAVLPRPTGLHQLSSLPSYRARFVGQLIIKARQAQEEAVLVDGLSKHLQGPFQPPFHPLSEAGQPAAGCGGWWYEPEKEEKKVAVSIRGRAKLGLQARGLAPGCGIRQGLPLIQAAPRPPCY